MDGDVLKKAKWSLFCRNQAYRDALVALRSITPGIIHGMRIIEHYAGRLYGLIDLLTIQLASRLVDLPFNHLHLRHHSRQFRHLFRDSFREELLRAAKGRRHQDPIPGNRIRRAKPCPRFGRFLRRRSIGIGLGLGVLWGRSLVVCLRFLHVRIVRSLVCFRGFGVFVGVLVRRLDGKGVLEVVWSRLIRVPVCSLLRGMERPVRSSATRLAHISAMRLTPSVSPSCAHRSSRHRIVDREDRCSWPEPTRETPILDVRLLVLKDAAIREIIPRIAASPGPSAGSGAGREAPSTVRGASPGLSRR